METQKHRKRNIIISVITGVVVILVGIGAWLFVDSARAVNEYVQAVDTQYKGIVAGKNLDKANVTLRGVALAETLNPRYKKMSEVDQAYQDLIDRLRNYTVTMDIYNKLVDEFNRGVNGELEYSSSLLDIVNELAAAVKKYYPDNEDIINGINSLGLTLANSVTFDEISVELNREIHRYETWLNDERDKIEASKAEFQQSINNV